MESVLRHGNKTKAMTFKFIAGLYNRKRLQVTEALANHAAAGKTGSIKPVEGH